jgi:hypothetical protein
MEGEQAGMRRRAIAGVGVLCIALAACDYFAVPSSSGGQRPTPPESEATTPQPPKPPRKPPVPPAPNEAEAPAEIAPAEPATETAKAEPTQRPVLKPESLIGLDQPETAALLGPPSERSEAAPATIWRYTGRSCQLEIYFYLDLKSQVMRALHYEVRTHEAAEPARSRCFADLVAEHQADPAASPNPPN